MQFLTSSYNESQRRSTELRHLFWPRPYTLLAELIIALVLLFFLNLGTFGEQLKNSGSGINASPLSLWGDVLNRFLSHYQYAIVQRVLLFVLWAMVGSLIYIVAFRFLQMFLRTRDSVRTGVSLISSQHTDGAIRYFASLHNFFIKMMIAVIGLAAILTGTLLCVTIASQQLYVGLNQPVPDNIVPLLLSAVGAFLGVRVFMLGLSLLSPRFRDWYNA